MPEAVIQEIMRTRNVSREEAERIYHQGQKRQLLPYAHHSGAGASSNLHLHPNKGISHEHTGGAREHTHEQPTKFMSV